MAACAGGELCAAWVAGVELPEYAREFSLERYKDAPLMKHLHASNKGVLQGRLGIEMNTILLVGAGRMGAAIVATIVKYS